MDDKAVEIIINEIILEHQNLCSAKVQQLIDDRLADMNVSSKQIFKALTNLSDVQKNKSD